MSSKPTVLVTGASGFVASHVASQLLAKGYPVRGTARGAKADSLRRSVGAKCATFEVVEVNDIATDDLTAVLRGIGAIIHVASPLASQIPVRHAIDGAVNGTLNVLRQAAQAKISKVVLTSSWGTTLDPSLKQTWEGVVFTEKDWGVVTEEEVLTGEHHPLWVYLATKILAESSAWKFAEEHSEMDIASINPPFIYGPYAPNFPIPDASALGTNKMLYALLVGSLPPQLPPFFCDVRDVARAHVAALDVPKKTPVQSKRFIVSGGAFTWKEAVEHIAVAQSDLTARLPSVDKAPPPPGKLSSIDTNRAKDVLGMGRYISWEKCVEDTVEALLVAEKTWSQT